jgi:PAS domain S-box-containing protein
VATELRLRELTDRLELEVGQRTRERDRIWQVSEDLLGVSNFAGYFVSINPAWTALLGWSEAEIKRMHVRELRHPDDAAAAVAQRERLARGIPTVRMENRFRHKDGSWRWLAWTLTAESGLIYVIGRHITAEKEAAERLRESERQFRLFVGGVTDYALFKLDRDGIVSSWNVGAQRIKGYTASEIIGQHFSRFYTPEDREAGTPARALETAATEGKYEAEGWRVRKDGERFWASVVIDAIHDEEGVLIGFAKITRDITERREAQLALQRMQEQLTQSQKMDALGQLTGGIAHDFNNMLMVVGGYTQFLKRRLTDEKNRRALDAIELAANRAESLTRQLLTFSRRQSINPVRLHLAERLAAFREILMSSARGNIDIDFAIPADLWPVTVDQNEFELAVLNLVVNARDAMPGGGSISIAARNVVLTARDRVDNLEGDFVQVEITDTGVGIPADVLPKVFDPFFTTKETGRGTGLGLSQVYGFAHQAGGSVRITSGLDVGTLVSLYLPRSHGTADDECAREKTGEPRGGHERVLLVEDNAEVRAVAADMLGQLGYGVVEADGAASALKIVDSNVGIDLVLTDMVMPGALDGLALARAIRQQRPALPVLLTTGYAKSVGSAQAEFPVLRKPYQLPALADALRTVLDRATGRMPGSSTDRS